VTDKISAGKWEEILQSEDLKQFLTSGNDNFDDERKFTISIACLLAFVQHNFTGPDVKVDEKSFRFAANDSDEKWKTESVFMDGIEINVNMKLLPLLIISRNFLRDLHSKHPQDLVSFRSFEEKYSRVI
jgi:hypothetical protein